MKRQLFFIVILGILLSSCYVSNAQNIKRGKVPTSTAKGKVHEVSYNGIFSDDICANLGDMGALLGIENSPNPYARLKNKLVALKLRFKENSTSPRIMISMGGKKEIDIEFSKVFSWDNEAKNLCVDNGNYVLVVGTQPEKYIGLMQLKNGKVAHRWEIKPKGNDLSWFVLTLRYAYIGMSAFKEMEETLKKGNHWVTMMASFEKAFPKETADAKKILEDAKKEIEAKKRPGSARTNTSNVETNNVNSMLLQAKAYHEGKTMDKTKNDIKAYYWYMKAYHALPQKSADDVMEQMIQALVPKDILDDRYDKSSYLSLKKVKAFLPSDNSYLKTSELGPFDLAVHPMGFLPTNMWNSKVSKIKKECEKEKGWTMGGSRKYLAVYNHGSKLPSLYGKAMQDITFSTFYNNSFEYNFYFDTYAEAESFLYRYAYDYLKKGIVFTNYLDASKGGTMNDDISLFSNYYSFIGNKEFKINNKISLITIKDNDGKKVYIVVIQMDDFKK